jgi:glucose-6-phosphate 1-epimerase
MPKLTLTFGRGGWLDVYINGATVTAWVPHATARNVLFLSQCSEWASGQPIRGGIPLAFPQFAGDGPLPNHGLARTATWRLLEHANGGLGQGGDADASSVASATLALAEADLPTETAQHWPKGCELRFHLQVTGLRLETRLEVLATSGPLPPFQALQHTYYAIPGNGAAAAAVDGLGGRDFLDKVKDRTRDRLEEGTSLTPVAETDRIFPAVAAPGTEAVVLLRAPGVRPRRILFSAARFEQDGTVGDPLACDLVVWNPWRGKASRMQDLGDDEWQDMICVEPGCVDAPVALEAGQRFVLTQKIHICDDAAKL